MALWRCLSIVLLAVAPSMMAAMEPDSADVALQEVVIEAVRSAVVPDIVPVQTLGGSDLRRLSSHNVADAMRYFAGVQVKDYGGVGGVKTVNVRSMGSAHTAVIYDGVALGNAQNGQIDLGQLSLDNVDAISLYNSGKSDLLQPARDRATAAAVYLRTRRPLFEEGVGRSYRLRAAFRGGSFGTVNPSLLYETRVSNTVSATVNAEWLYATGKYRFHVTKTAPDGTSAYDTTAVRQNGDVNTLRAEVNFFGTLNHGTWTAKAYGFHSARGIPGAIVNNVWKRGERQSDNNVFVQGRYSGYYGRFSTMAMLKLAHYYTHYINEDERQLKVDNTFRQQEGYGSVAGMYAITDWWQASLSYDLMLNAMTSDVRDFVRAVRTSNYLAVATTAAYRRLRADASLTATYIADASRGRQQARHRSAYSPAVALAYGLTHDGTATLRAQYKQTFRMPTFNDLYYTDMGNANLRPERVQQCGLGIASAHSFPGVIHRVEASADAYYNNVTDKIIAYPRGNQFRWTMLNLGHVHITGVDVSALLSLKPDRRLEVILRGQYTWQRAVDRTSASDTFYGHQIPYVPHNSGSAVVNVIYGPWQLNASLICVGQRYSGQENTPSNLLGAWRTVDLSVGRDIAMGECSLRVMAELNNVLNKQYEVIRHYPMPGINARATAVLTF